MNELVKQMQEDASSVPEDNMGKIGAVATDIAETENHHPNISFTWGSVTITIWTHKIDGMVESDFIFAAKSDQTHANEFSSTQ